MSRESGRRPVDADDDDALGKHQRDGRFYRAPDRECVDALLDISEEEQQAYESQTQSGWEEAMQGWGQSSPLACLFQAHSKGTTVKSDVIDSHCVLCADLKHLKLSEILGPERSGTSVELSCETAEEPLSTTPELLKRAPSNISSCSSPEEEKSDFYFVQERNKSDSLEDELLFEGEPCINNQTLPHPPQHNTQWPFLKDEGVEKIALISPLIVLPPVKESAQAKPKSPGLLNKREVSDLHQAKGEAEKAALCGTSGPVIFGEKVDVDGELDSPYSSSTLDARQGSLTFKQRLAQHQYHLLSTLSTTVSKRHQPFSTMADPIARATSLLGRNLKQYELTKSALKHTSGHRLHFGFRSKNLRRTEPELPMLLGTRVPIPVSTQRLL
ncbi:hypothetical protein P4O66_018391 [Electrophorus voltai]|uniref:Uncharacterized protein n=1 Tax=Electrophorus voltai TaxID=2609070 RepID=A0AAD8YSB5_9TELE|nr:hypothetical protein P4O66_018391 [Electrophorus voltai]